jgi:hypothetical protein
MVEHSLAKAEVEGSSPSFRSWLRRSVVTSGAEKRLRAQRLFSRCLLGSNPIKEGFFRFFIDIGLVFSVPYCIEKNALDGCPGIEKEGRFQRRKAMGRYRLWSMDLRSGNRIRRSVASLRSLDFSNLANWNIWVAKGREINRDPVSSGERERIGGLKKNKHEASFLSKVFTSFSPGFIRFVVDWMMEKPATLQAASGVESSRDGALASDANWRTLTLYT